LSLLAISAGLTAATLIVVSNRVDKRVRESLREDLRNSLNAYQTFERQREAEQIRSAELLANVPYVRALMTSRDLATIQNQSAETWRVSREELLVLADRVGTVSALHLSSAGLSREEAQQLLRGTMKKGIDWDWWFGGGHLYEVAVKPVYAGSASNGVLTGLLVVGHEVDNSAARDFGKVLASDVVFRCGSQIIANTLTSSGKDEVTQLGAITAEEPGVAPREVQLGSERFLASTINLSSDSDTHVTLSVLRSLDKATSFLNGLNRALLGLGLLSVLAGGVLVFLISHTFTKPLSNLVSGVRALEQGRFDYPLQSTTGDEVGEVTTAFSRMRTTLQSAQNEQKQLEDRLRQAHKMEAVGRLAGGVAHDFNNLLTIIGGNADILADRESSDNILRRCVEQIQKASNRAVGMTRQLLAFSRMQVLQPRVMDLNAVVGEMGKMLPRLIGEHIEYTFVPDTELGPVLADPGQMEQVLLNLTVNARDAMAQGGKLTVRTRNMVIDEMEAAKRPPMAPGSYALLSVSDTGHGMDAKTRAHIFEPFFTTKEFGKGTGLGLATVYGIVKQSGGFIWVESEPGQGATFEIYLPHSKKSAVDKEESGKPTALPRGTETVLVVEDEPGIREIASSFLRENGYTVLEGRDGVEALEVATRYSGKIHLLLSDIVMPRMGGKDLAARLAELRPDARVAFMSGYAEFSGNDDVKGPQIPVLQKPFSKQSLLEKVRDVLSCSQEALPGPKVSG
jgi:signal transduction histidine kinase/CheY-like chemotaxis protein